MQYHEELYNVPICVRLEERFYRFCYICSSIDPFNVGEKVWLLKTGESLFRRLDSDGNEIVESVYTYSYVCDKCAESADEAVELYQHKRSLMNL